MMTKDFKDLLKTLNAHAVKYLLIGGHAFSVHSQPRTTKDLDVFIRSDPENPKAVFQALSEFGASLRGMTPADFADGTTFQMGLPPNRIDVLRRIDGITFDEAWANHIEGNVDGELETSVISREDLIRNKLATGREQDLLDVKVLRKAADAVRRGSNPKV